jgi:hypothetical protein
MPERNFSPKFGEWSDDERRLINERFRDLLLVYQQIVKVLPVPGYRMSYTGLVLVCGYYANDLKELKAFHGVNDGRDDTKCAAYLARLIARFRPIQIDEIRREIPADYQYFLIRINEIFAIRAFEYFLKVPNSVMVTNEYDEFKKEMLFIFRFRDPDKDMMVAQARLVKAWGNA